MLILAFLLLHVSLYCLPFLDVISKRVWIIEWAWSAVDCILLSAGILTLFLLRAHVNEPIIDSE